MEGEVSHGTWEEEMRKPRMKLWEHRHVRSEQSRSEKEWVSSRPFSTFIVEERKMTPHNQITS